MLLVGWATTLLNIQYLKNFRSIGNAFYTNFHGPERKHSGYFDDPQTIPPAPHFRLLVKYLNNKWMDFCDILYRHVGQRFNFNLLTPPQTIKLKDFGDPSCSQWFKFRALSATTTGWIIMKSDANSHGPQIISP